MRWPRRLHVEPTGAHVRQHGKDTVAHGVRPAHCPPDAAADAATGHPQPNGTADNSAADHLGTNPVADPATDPATDQRWRVPPQLRQRGPGRRHLPAKRPVHFVQRRPTPSQRPLLPVSVLQGPPGSDRVAERSELPLSR